jgi:CysZ protein
MPDADDAYDVQPVKSARPVARSHSVIGGFFAGATYPLRALKVLKDAPRLLQYVVFPILLNILLGLILYVSLVLPGFRAIDRLDGLGTRLPEWLAFLSAALPVVEVLLQVVAGIALLLLTGFLLLQFGSILGSPWYGKLSEELEKIRTGKEPTPEPFSPFAIARDLWRAIMFELKKLGLIIVIGGLLLLCNLIPGAGTLIAAGGGIALGATIVCLDFFDAPLERRRLSFRHKLRLVWRSFPASATFGLVCFLLVGIPFVNLIAIPICVAAGTLFVCDRVLHRL